MDGLIIKKHWLDKILYDLKRLEIRGSDCFSHYMQKIGLIESGSGLIMGSAILRSAEKISREKFHYLANSHFVDNINDVSYKTIWGWWFYDVKVFDKPIPYKHPKGAVIWVREVL